MHFNTKEPGAYERWVKMIERGVFVPPMFLVAVITDGGGAKLAAISPGKKPTKDQTIRWGSLYLFKVADGLLAIIKSRPGLPHFGRYTKETFPPTVVIAYEPRGLSFTCCAVAESLTEKKSKRTIASLRDIQYEGCESALTFKCLSGSGNNRYIAALHRLADCFFATSQEN